MPQEGGCGRTKSNHCHGLEFKSEKDLGDHGGTRYKGGAPGSSERLSLYLGAEKRPDQRKRQSSCPSCKNQNLLQGERGDRNSYNFEASTPEKQ